MEPDIEVCHIAAIAREDLVRISELARACGNKAAEKRAILDYNRASKGLSHKGSTYLIIIIIITSVFRVPKLANANTKTLKLNYALRTSEVESAGRQHTRPVIRGMCLMVSLSPLTKFTR